MRVLAHLAMLFVTCTFSLWNVLGELVLKRGFDPIVLATYRELGTATLLLIGSIALHRGSGLKRFRPDMRQAALFVACGVGGVYGLQLFYVLGLARTDANTAALFQPLVPVLVLLLSALLGIERLRLRPWGEAAVLRSWQKLAGVVLACGGCLLVVSASNGGGGSGGGGGGGGTSGETSGGETSGETSGETGSETGGARQLGLAFLLVSDLGAATFIVSQVSARRHTPNQLCGMHHAPAPCARLALNLTLTLTRSRCSACTRRCSSSPPHTRSAPPRWRRPPRRSSATGRSAAGPSARSRAACSPLSSPCVARSTMR